MVKDGRAIIRYPHDHDTVVRMLDRNGKKDVIRDALVTQAIPQKSCPMVEMTSTALAADDVRADSMIDCEVPPAASIAFVCVAANVSASSTNQPNSAE